MPDVFDPQIVGSVKNLTLRSMRLVESIMAGMHKSRLRGISTEFAQHRQYAPGDDTKHLDWKVYAKTDRFFVKEYEAETSMSVWMLVDTSKSMFFKSDQAAMSKFEYAATIAATLAWMMTQQKDTFGLALFDEKVRSLLPPKGSGSHFRNMVDTLEKAEPGGETNVAKTLMTVGPQIKQRSIVILVSDFIDTTEEMSLGLGRMSYAGHDVLPFHIEDPIERDFPFAGQTIFLGPENEGKLLCDPRDYRVAYMKERQRHIDEIRDTCQKFGYYLEAMHTDKPLDQVLSGVLMTRLLRKR